MDSENYVAECERHLSKTSSYKSLEKDPKQKNNKLVNNEIERFKNDKYLTRIIAQNLITTNSKTPKFNIAQNIHETNKPG